MYQLVSPLLSDNQEAYLILDDSVQDKRYSSKIKLIKRQYNEAAHGLVRGIGVVNLVHSDGTNYYLIDFRIYARETDSKTKNQYFREMFLAAIGEKGLQAEIVLFNSWYASLANLKLIYRSNRYFVTTLKANRLVSHNPQTAMSISIS